jgi:hypothetical protein
VLGFEGCDVLGELIRQRREESTLLHLRVRIENRSDDPRQPGQLVHVTRLVGGSDVAYQRNHLVVLCGQLLDH